jgi:cysteine desulfurase
MALQARLEQEILAISPEAVVIGGEADRIANTTLFAVPGISAETAVIALDLEGIAVSAGSACSSGKVGPSHVLEAMGASPEICRSGVRVSLTSSANAVDVEAFSKAWRGIHARLRQSQAA